MKYSVVIPLMNEEDNISDLVQELEPIMNSLNEPWELICIDDGSTDNTLKVLHDLKKSKSYLRILKFKRNVGQSAAFDAGFRAAKGDFVITLDGDRQNDPHDIPQMLSIIHEADLVCGHRVNRKDTFTKRLTSRVANRFRKVICADNVNDTGCSLKIYRRSCFDKIKLYRGMHRFFPALFLIEGFRVKEIPVNHRERTRGTTKYNFFNRSFNTIADMLAVRWMRKRHLNYEIEQEF